MAELYVLCHSPFEFFILHSNCSGLTVFPAGCFILAYFIVSIGICLADRILLKLVIVDTEMKSPLRNIN